MAEKRNGYSRRTIAFFGLVLIGIVIGTLIYLEQIAVLYILATLSLVALLLVVGAADLENVGRENLEGFSNE